MPFPELDLTIPHATRETVAFAGQEATVYSAKDGTKLDVLPLLVAPEEFHGDAHVDHLVQFHGIYEPLIGKFSADGRWNPDTLKDQGIVVLEYYHSEARQLAETVNALAQRIVADPSLYDDAGIAAEYFALAQAGYGLLRKHEAEYGFDTYGIPVSLERAGLVATRLALGAAKDEVVPNEVRVVTKRTHLKGDRPTHLSATVSWRDPEQLSRLVNGQDVELIDFVNPASGASGAAFVLAARQRQAMPRQVVHRAVNLTAQGVLMTKQTFANLGIETRFYSVGGADELNDHYYLVGSRAVADAGHILRHFLPADYQA